MLIVLVFFGLGLLVTRFRYPLAFALAYALGLASLALTLGYTLLFAAVTALVVFTYTAITYWFADKMRAKPALAVTILGVATALLIILGLGNIST